VDTEAFLEVLRSRRSIRSFTDRKPERAMIERLIQAACWAPSNHNRQGWKFVVLEDEQVIRRLANECRRRVREALAAGDYMTEARAEELIHYAGAFEAAPVVILAMHKRSPAVGKAVLEAAVGPWASGEVLSTAMAVQNLCLAAHAMGMGTCVMTAPLLAGRVWAELPDSPAGFEPTCLVTLGYPAAHPDPPNRKELKHVVEYR
jgi:nitroreductase